MQTGECQVDGCIPGKVWIANEGRCTGKCISYSFSIINIGLAGTPVWVLTCYCNVIVHVVGKERLSLKL